MKKSFLLLMLVLSTSLAFGQRKIEKETCNLSKMEVEYNRSYILRDNSRVLDGPVTAKGSSDGREWINYQLGYMLFKQNYNLSANNKNGVLSGPISMVYNSDISIPDANAREVLKANLKGAYVDGLPNGTFTYSLVKDGEVKADVKVTYDRGCFTGDFKFIDKIYDNNNPNTHTTGQFTSDGKPTGKWYVFYRNNYAHVKSDATNYEFLNGVLVGGDLMTNDASVIDYAKKYATNEITREQLLACGIMLQEQYLNMYGSTSEVLNIYDEVAKVMAEYVNFHDVGEKYNKSSSAPLLYYTKVFKIPYFTDESFEQYLNSFYSDNPIFMDNILKTYDGIEDKYVKCYGRIYMSAPYETVSGSEWKFSQKYDDMNWGYFLTDQQCKRLEEFATTCNGNIISKLLNDELYDSNVNINGAYYSVISHEVVEGTNSVNGVTIELKATPTAGSDIDGAYHTYRVNVVLTSRYNISFSTFTRVRNIYDDLDDVIAAHDAAIDNVVGYLQQLKNAHVIDSYEDAVEVQLVAFNSKIRDIDINHNNLNATIKSFIDQTAMVNHFHAYMEYYPQAKDLEAQIAARQISKYTTTTSPVVPDWSKSLDLESMKSLVATQQNILKQYDDYCALKEKSAENHSKIAAKKLSVLSLYNDTYNNTISAMVSLEEGIKQYSNLLTAQHNVEQYIELYERIVANNVELRSKLKPAKCAAKAYGAYYKALDLSWSEEGAFERANEVISKQQALLEISQRSTLAEDDKRVKKLKLTEIDDIIKAY